MNKQNRILAGLLAVQLVVVAIVFWPHPVASGTSASLFPGVSADQIASLTITDATGNTIQLAKSNGAWVLPNADDYPVEADKVPSFLDKIVGLKAERLVTQTSSSHARLKVAKDNFERLVYFVLDEGTHHQLYMGSSPSYGAIHVRADDQNEVYLASDLSTQDAGVQATSWVDSTYLEIPEDQIVGVILENANGRLEFEKTGDTWTLKGLAADETLAQDQVTTLISRARLVTMSQPLGKELKAEYGLDNPSAVVTVYTHSDSGDKTYTLTVGAQDPTDKSYVVISSESEYYVRVSEYSAQNLVEKARADFIQPPATPEPTQVPGATPQGQ
jgi:hypothetical protein